jgi:hypothetical protein
MYFDLHYRLYYKEKQLFSNKILKIFIILRIDTAAVHRVYDNMLQRAQKCIDVQGDHFQHFL